MAALCCTSLALGCARERYRRRADNDTAGILYEKASGTAWEIPTDFDPYPAPNSRLADPSSPDCPQLPPSTPRLHRYEIPDLNSSRDNRPEGSVQVRGKQLQRQPADASGSGTLPGYGKARHDTAATTQPEEMATSELVLTAAEHQFDRSHDHAVTLADGFAAVVEQATQNPSPQVQSYQAAGLPLLPIPAAAWEALPNACLLRMLEFESVRREYIESFRERTVEVPRDSSRRLSLDEVIALALLNSREYQSQKEQLYRAALALTLQRYDYQLKFTPTGNGTVVDYVHSRTDGTTTNTLGIASTFGLTKMLATGGNLLARFANDVVLTFNGPQGFAADVNSELFFGLTQSVLQRDVRFEPLIQAERDVIYAARDFARFRKVFFFERASDYYLLIRRYRQIEIDSQNYVSLVRALNQAEAEEQAGLQSRVQVEQIEQQMLTGRRNLTATCNGLESSLDRFKIVIGLPTETAIALSLDELNELNLRDEIQVAAERVTRAQRRLQAQNQKQKPDLGELLNSAIVLNERLLDWLRLRERAGHDVAMLRQLELVAARLRVDDARLAAQRSREALQTTRRSEPAAPPVLLFQRIGDVIDAMRKLVLQQLELATLLDADAATIMAIRTTSASLTSQAAQLRERLDVILKGAQVEQLAALTREAEQLMSGWEEQVRAANQLIEAPADVIPLEQQLAETQKQVEQLIGHTQLLLDPSSAGLVELQIEAEDAMLTALASRLDLMNERGRVADERRAVKITADDLRSVLNLRAEQTIRSRHNEPLNFTFDESETRLNLALDLPLNRRAQRNAYRRALLDYQAALRSLTESEDNIKLAIRDELRDLALARTQYHISVASAALAAERVESTRLQLALGSVGVAARDFLEAQDDYRSELSAVADNHVGYVISRARFFLDTELMLLDETGFWRALHQEDFQPAVRHSLDPAAGPPYGEVPAFLWLSHELRHVFEDQP